MMLLRLSLILFCIGAAAPLMAKPCVILLHGLARSPLSMSRIEAELSRDGFQVQNIAYPSTAAQIQTLADSTLPAAIDACPNPEHIDFVTHSMGGILVRDYFARHKGVRPHRVVMLGPPNKGSELIDSNLYQELGRFINGKAGNQLSAENGSYVNQLPPVDYPVGIIAGKFSWNPYYSDILPGADDGKVTVLRTWVNGASDWIVMNVSHTFMMENPAVIRQVKFFLENGEFEK